MCHFYAKYAQDHLYQKLGHFGQNWRRSIFFRAKLGYQFFCRVSKKYAVFRPKIGKFSAKFPKILQINKNHLNTSYVKILGHLGHFLAKYDHFWSFLAHFGLYNYIGEKAGRASYRVIPHLASTAVYGHIFWTAQPIFKMLGILERGDQGLSDKIKNKKIWKKVLYPPLGVHRLVILAGYRLLPVTG